MTLPSPQQVSRLGIYFFAVTIPISFVPAEFGIAIAVLGWLAQGLREKQWIARWHIFFVPYLFYIFWNFLSATLSHNPPHTFLAVLDNEWPVLLMLMMFWTIDDEEKLKWVVFLFLGSASLAMLYGIWQTAFGVEYYRGMLLYNLRGLHRSVGFYGFYLTFAAFAMSVFFLSSALALGLRTKEARWIGLLAAVSFVTILGTFARSVWVAMVAVTPLLGFLKGKRFGLIATAVLVIVVMGLYGTVPTFHYRAASILDLSRNQVRINLWETSLLIAKDYPLTGVGQDNFNHFFQKYKVEGYYDTGAHPHNDYLTILVCSGIPGLLAFMAMWVIALRVGFRIWKRETRPLVRMTSAGATLGLLGFLVACFFQNYYGTFANCLGWWFLVGLIFACTRLYEGSTDHAEQ